MTKEEAIKHFGTQTAMALALARSAATVSEWVSIPPLCQLRLQHLTGRKLVADAKVRKYVGIE